VTPKFESLPNPEALARRAADLLIAAANETADRFAVALSGGSTPRRLYELLARPPYRDAFPWHRTHVFWGDERFVPKADARSNYRMTYEALLSHVPIPPANVHPIPTEDTTPADAAMGYEKTLKSFYAAAALDPLRPLFDVALLGLGADGHIASLFPGSRAVAELERWVVAVTEGPAEPRLSLTYPPLESSRRVLVLVEGPEKRAIVGRVRRGDDLPATKLKPVGTLLWLVDKAAAGQS
jgi:6-phosphogluconolactonase